MHELITPNVTIAFICIIVFGLAAWLYRSAPNFQTISIGEKIIKSLLVVASLFSILITVAIVFSVIYESAMFFKIVPLNQFLFGTEWSPQIAMRADQAGSSGAFGALPLFVGTVLITVIAMLIAAPLGLFAAIYLSEYASRPFRSYVKPALEILAGIPTVVYGYFAALTIAPLIRNAGEYFGLEVASESALAAGLVMGIMIIPYVLSLSDDIINAVPQSCVTLHTGLAQQSQKL